MYLWELTRQIFRNMRARKIRTTLAMFGIVWGTVSVVLLLALGQGFYETNKRGWIHILDGSLVAHVGTTRKPFHGLPIGRRIHIKSQDVMALKQALPEIQWISPVIHKHQNVSRGKHTVFSTIRGVSPDFAILHKREPLPGGRFINALDVKKHQRVIFLSTQLKDKLFPKESALGKQVIVNSIPFTVIGVRKPYSHTGNWNHNSATIPYTTGISMWGDLDVAGFPVSPFSHIDVDQFEKHLSHYLSIQYRFDPKDKALRVFNPKEVMQFFSWFFHSIEWFLGLCGALTLAVGGIGVANILFLIITERTAEIGLRLAVGARTSHIMSQIMLEAGIIVICGGLIGFLLSVSALFALHHIDLPHWLGTPVFSPWLMCATLFILMSVALLAGYFPARRAAKMQPVQALGF